MRWRRPPLQHPLAPVFAHAIESLCTALTPSSKRNYDIVVRMRHSRVIIGVNAFLVFFPAARMGGCKAATHPLGH